MGFLRIWSLAALCIGLWLLAVYGLHRPAPLGAEAPASAFSAVRASAALGKVLGPEKPHPAGSPENEAVHLRLLEALADLGVDVCRTPITPDYLLRQLHEAGRGGTR